MPDTKPYNAIMQRDGTSRNQRQDTVLLNQNFVLPDERPLEDLLKFAKSYAQKIIFYDNANTDFGTWENFFNFNFDINEIENLIGKKEDFEPHLALYLAFLQMFGYAQKHINKITKRHLDYYYENVLGLARLPGEEDDVYVIFELAKNVSELELEKDTLLDAGKNPDGKQIQYQLTENAIINTAQVKELRTVYVDAEDTDIIRVAHVANSSDGMRGKLNPDAAFWDAFGNTNLSKIKTGFALASPVLLMKEGQRVITATISLTSVKEDLAKVSGVAGETVEIYYTGEKNWLGPYAGTVTFGTFSGNSQSIIITQTLDNDQGSIVNYNSKLHSGTYYTETPVMQVQTDTTTASNLWGALKDATVTTVKIDVDVTGISNMQIENDFGELNPKKPFQPFGAQPKTGSAFSVKYDEILQKELSDFTFDVLWQAPESKLSNYYNNYTFGTFVNPVTNNTWFKAKITTWADATGKTTNLFNADDATQQVTWPDSSSPSGSLYNYLAGLSFTMAYNTYNSLLYHPNFYIGYYPIYNVNIFSLVGLSSPAKVPVQKGYIRFELQKDFLHSRYAGIYAAIIKNATTLDPVSLPNEPYTPVIKSIKFNYKASTGNVNIASDQFVDFTSKKIQLFHIGAFGVAEQHGYLKAQTTASNIKNAVIDTLVYLYPHYNNEGEFFVGFENAVAGNSVSMLLQIAEGTANPDKAAVDPAWYALCNNEWVLLQQADILKDETNHLLQSGIVKIVLPQAATNDNTIMPSGFFWIKAAVKKDTDAVCKFISVTSQAARAEFVKTDELTPANTLAAGTITKMVSKPAEVKKVEQPYASFGGQFTETDNDYYIRISERLRHKNRAVTSWDYEHIVLQKFADVYKVKCLNHTGPEEGNCCSTLMPGNVTLVVVPDIRNKNSYNPLQPKVSLATITNIKDTLQPLASFFTGIHVQNPDYETVLLDFKVRFKTAGDFGLYSKKLNEAIVQYLTPWAYSSKSDIHFGGIVRKSVILNFIEEQEDVDFLTDFKMFHIDEDGKKSRDVNEIVIINPRAILVSEPEHIIHEIKQGELVC